MKNSRLKRVVLASACGVLFVAGAKGCVDAGDEASIDARVLPYKGGAKGAYSIIHDDACDGTTRGLQQYAQEELAERELPAGFGIIGSACERGDQAPWLKSLVDEGHEIINHTWSHDALVPCDAVESEWQSCSEERPDYVAEIDQTAEWVADQVGLEVDFFIFPFDSFDDVAIDYLAESGYLGARAGERGFNSPEDIDPLRLDFDTYGPDFSIYKDQVDSGEVDNILDQYADDAVERGDWAIRELHGVEDPSWETVPLEEYQAHLDHVKDLVDAGDLWVETPTTITRYLMSRAHCGEPVVEDYVLNFTGADKDCERYLSKLTVRVSRDHLTTGLLAVQEDIVLATWPDGDEAAIIEGVDPTKPVLLDFSGVFTGPDGVENGAAGAEN